MPIITGSPHVFTFLKKGNIVFTGIAAASITVTHQPPAGGSYLKVTVSGGTTNSGTVTISGTLSGAAKTDTLTYTAARWYITDNQYDTIATVTTVGLADEATKPTITIEACDASGAAVSWTTADTYYGVFKQPPSRREMVRALAEGLNAPSFYECLIDSDVNVSVGDLFSVAGQTGQTYAVWSEPLRHFHIGTDLVDYVSFYATLKSKGS